METQQKSYEQTKWHEDEADGRQMGFAILKPDALAKGLVEHILATIESSGLKVVAQKLVVLDESIIRKLYGDRILPEWSAELFRYLSSGQSVVLIIDGQRTNERLMEIRNQIRRENACDFLHNLIHASDTFGEAKEEAKLFFEL